MPHDAYLPAMRALKARLKELDDEREKVLHALTAIQALPEPPNESADGGKSTKESPSYPEAVEAVLEEKGRALHIDKIAAGFKEHDWYADKDFIDNRSHRNSLIGSLDRKARKGDTFYKPEPATYGLLKWRENGNGSQADKTPTPERADVGANPNEGR